VEKSYTQSNVRNMVQELRKQVVEQGGVA
jgi:hypothetical protein